MKSFRYVFFICSFLLACLSLSYYYVLLPQNAQAIVKALFLRYSRAQIELKIKETSILDGFVIEDCTIRLLDTKEELLYFKRARLLFSLPALFLGKIELRHLNIEKGRFHIKKSQGVWSWKRAFPDASKAGQKHRQAKAAQERREAPSSVFLYMPLRFHAKIELKDCAYFMSTGQSDGRAGRQKGPLKLHIQNIDLKLNFLSRRSFFFPLDASILDFWQHFELRLMPRPSLQILFAWKDRLILQGRPAIEWAFLYSEGKSKPALHSSLSLDTAKLYVRDSYSRAPQALGIKLRYDSYYDSAADRFVLKRFAIHHNKERWLNIQAALNHLHSPDRSLDLKADKSHINLAPMGKLLLALYSPADMRHGPIRGKLEMESLALYGSLDRLSLRTKIKASDIFFPLQKTKQLLKALDINIQARMDISAFLPKGYQSALKQPKALAFGVFESLRMPRCMIFHEKFHLQAQAYIRPEKGIQAHIELEDFDLDFFSNKEFGGRIKADLQIQSNKDWNTIDVELAMRAQKAYYNIRNSFSESFQLKGKAKGQLRYLSQKLLGISWQKLHIKAHDLDGSPLLDLESIGAYRSLKQKKSISVHLEKSRLIVQGESFFAALPPYLRDLLRNYKTYMQSYKGRKLSLYSTKLRWQLEEEENILQAECRWEIPAFKVYDLGMELDIQIHPKKLLLRRVKLQGLKGALRGDMEGQLRLLSFKQKASSQKHLRWEPQLDMTFQVFSKEFLNVHENVSLQGGFALQAKLRPEKLQARLHIPVMNLEFLSGNCAGLDKTACRSLFIQGLALDELRIEHSLAGLWHAQKARGALLKHRHEYAQKPYQTQDYKLRIGRIFSSHDPQGNYKAQGRRRWHYIGYPQGPPGLGASLSYRNNALHIAKLRIEHFHRPLPHKDQWSQNGIIQASNIILNLADLNPEHMSCAFRLKIQELDLRSLLAPLGSSYDASISLDLRAEMPTLSSEAVLNKMKASLSIHRISPEFGGFVTRLLVPTQLMSLLVRNTLEITSIRVKLQEGLLYSYIQPQRAAMLPGLFFSTGGKEIKQERIPLAAFLKKARKEVSYFEEDKQAKEP